MTLTMSIPQSATDYPLFGGPPCEKSARAHLDGFVENHIAATVEILDACLGDGAGAHARNLAELASRADTDVPALAVAAAAVLDDFNTIDTSPTLIARHALRTVTPDNLDAAIRFNGARVEGVVALPLPEA
jgi:hypothetical protein